MWSISIILCLALILIPEVNFNFLNIIGNFLHFECLKSIPESSSRALSLAVVCGNGNFIEFRQNELLKNSGLIHLVVVSASHLLFIDWFLSKFKTPLGIRFILLFGYTLTTLMQAPAVRSLIHMSIQNMTRKLFWTGYEISLVSTLSLFLANRSFVHSYSALLSATASLGNSTPYNHYQKNILIYFLLLPPLIGLSAPHPLSILLNICMAPLIGFVIFPLSIINIFIPISFVIDTFWNYVFKILELLPIQSLSSFPKIPIYYLWIYVFILTTYFVIKEKYEMHRLCHPDLTVHD